IRDVHAGPGEREGDRAGVCPGRHDEVVFEPALIAVVHDVDARIHTGVAHPGESGNARGPLRGVTANEVVGLAGEIALSSGPGWVRAYQRHAEAVLLQRQYRLSRRQEDAVAGASGDEVHAWVALAGVLLEAHRQLAVRRGGRGRLRSHIAITD